MMHIDRPMVKLFFDLKRQVPFEMQDQMKLASPQLGVNLVEIYQQSRCPAIRSQIEEFLARAGNQWQSKLSA